MRAGAVERTVNSPWFETKAALPAVPLNSEPSYRRAVSCRVLVPLGIFNTRF